MNSNTYVGSKLARTPHPCVYSDVISLALLVSMGDTAPPEGDSQLDRHEAFEEPRHARNRVGKELLPLQQNTTIWGCGFSPNLKRVLFPWTLFLSIAMRSVHSYENIVWLALSPRRNRIISHANRSFWIEITSASNEKESKGHAYDVGG